MATTKILGKEINALSAENAVSASYVSSSQAAGTTFRVALLDGTNITPIYYDHNGITYNADTNQLNVAGSISATSITASLFGTATTASFATTAATSSYLLGSVTSASFANTARNIYNASPAETQNDNYILFNSPNQNAYNTAATDTTLVFNPTSVTLSARNFRSTTSSTVSGSTILSGSTTITGPVTVTGSFSVTSSAITVANFSGNQNGYIEFALRNVNGGVSASTDIACYANNGSATANYIDMGIMGSGYTGASYDGIFLGKANDSYLYNDGGHLAVGNANNQNASGSLFLFAHPNGLRADAGMTITGSRVGVNKTGSINANVDISGSTIVSGSLRGQVILPTIITNTASLDFSITNFFTCSLANGVTTHVSASNYLPGQTINMLIVQGSAGTGKVSFPAAFKSGSLYTGSAVANAIDIVTFITFDTTNIYLSAIRNLK